MYFVPVWCLTVPPYRDKKVVIVFVRFVRRQHVNNTKCKDKVELECCVLILQSEYICNLEEVGF
jgi:hypothetical protein